MSKKQRLELAWIGKDVRPKLEPRILLEDSTKSHHATHRVAENDIFGNRLIFGDSLLTLKASEQKFSGEVKCVFIDPPLQLDRWAQWVVNKDENAEMLVAASTASACASTFGARLKKPSKTATR